MYPMTQQDDQMSRGCHADCWLVEDVQPHVSAARMILQAALMDTNKTSVSANGDGTAAVDDDGGMGGISTTRDTRYNCRRI